MLTVSCAICLMLVSDHLTPLLKILCVVLCHCSSACAIIEFNEKHVYSFGWHFPFVNSLEHKSFFQRFSFREKESFTIVSGLCTKSVFIHNNWNRNIMCLNIVTNGYIPQLELVGKMCCKFSKIISRKQWKRVPNQSLIYEQNLKNIIWQSIE